MPEAPRVTVLIGDDEPLLLKLIQRILAPRGYALLTAVDGDEAVRLAREAGPVHAVLLDAGMPPGGAGDALERILAHQPDVGVVLTSGAALPSELMALCDRHGGIFLRKPFAPAALVEAVENALARRAAG